MSPGADLPVKSKGPPISAVIPVLDKRIVQVQMAGARDDTRRSLLGSAPPPSMAVGCFSCPSVSHEVKEWGNTTILLASTLKPCCSVLPGAMRGPRVAAEDPPALPVPIRFQGSHTQRLVMAYFLVNVRVGLLTSTCRNRIWPQVDSGGIVLIKQAGRKNCWTKCHEIVCIGGALHCITFWIRSGSRGVSRIFFSLL